MHSRKASRLAPLLCSVLLAACGGDSRESGAAEAGEAADTTVASAPAAAAAPAPGAPTSAPLTVEDIDRWQRGMEAELYSVQQTGESMPSLTTAEDSAEAIAALGDMGTLAEGAAAAGVSEERYEFIRTTLSRASAFLAPDTAGMPAAMVEQGREGRERALTAMEAELPPEVREALRPRAAALRQLDLRLVGERLRLAGG